MSITPRHGRPPVRAECKCSLHTDYDRSKFLVIGDSGVGKSCLVERFSEGRFSKSFMPTIGVDIKNRLLRTAIGKKVQLQIWDTAGQERFKTVTTLYRGAKAAVLCYDTTDRDSFEHLRTWLRELRTYAPTCRIAIAGTKTDLASAIKPKMINGKMNNDVWWNECEDAQAFADELDVPLVRCSAKSGDGVEELFMQLAESLVKDHMKLRARYRKDTAAAVR